MPASFEIERVTITEREMLRETFKRISTSEGERRKMLTWESKTPDDLTVSCTSGDESC